MTSRRELLLAGASAALMRAASAEAAPGYPPFLIRFQGRDGRIRLPGGGTLVVPAGSEMLVEPPRYFYDALVFEFVPADESRIFIDGFES